MMDRLVELVGRLRHPYAREDEQQPVMNEAADLLQSLITPSEAAVEAVAMAIGDHIEEAHISHLNIAARASLLAFAQHLGAGE